MHRFPLRRALGLLLGLALLTPPLLGAAARAADKDKSSKVTFETRDGVKLKGTFYPSPKGKDEPTVLLLHKIGSDSHKDGWDSIADKLNDKGFAVLSFDLRGHGDSTEVDPEKFWLYKWNSANIKGGATDAKGKLKEAIAQSGFMPAYYPYLVNDVVAAKLFLDERNDAGECNSQSLIVIGAEDGAALGALWMGSEWQRYSASVIADPRGPRFRPFITSVSADPEGKSQYAAIWLSITPVLGEKVQMAGSVRAALQLVGKKAKVPMAFVYGDKDEKSQKYAGEFLKILKGTTAAGEKDPLPFTGPAPIKGSALVGGGLLRKDLNTADDILKYVSKVREKNAPAKWSKIDIDRTGYIWKTSRGAIAAKEDKGKSIEPLPLAQLGLLP